MKRIAFAAALLLAPLESFGQEVILTPERDPRSSPDYDKRKAMGDWARGVMERAATGEAAPQDEPYTEARGCIPPADREPHGVVWGEIGTGGYTSVGAIVTQPVGDCASLTVGVSRSEGRRSIRRTR